MVTPGMDRRFLNPTLKRLAMCTNPRSRLTDRGRIGSGKLWVFNAGHQIGQVPAYIELDLTVHEAKWVSIMGTERVDLRDLVALARSVF